MNTSLHKPSRSRTGGFTLVEIIITTAILGVVMTMALIFFIQSSKSAYINEKKNLINNDIRKLTAEMSNLARQANYVILYSSFEDDERDSATDRLLDGKSGDFIILGFQDEPDLDAPIFAPRPTNRIVGFFRSPEDPDDPSSTGPVKKFDTDEMGGISPPANPLNPPTPEDLIPAFDELTDNPDAFEEIVELSEGLANERLFYNFGDETIMINGKIIHGSDAKRVTDTYNMTISTRN